LEDSALATLPFFVSVGKERYAAELLCLGGRWFSKNFENIGSAVGKTPKGGILVAGVRYNYVVALYSQA
jgi:hypothetical protein